MNQKRISQSLPTADLLVGQIAERNTNYYTKKTAGQKSRRARVFWEGKYT